MIYFKFFKGRFILCQGVTNSIQILVFVEFEIEAKLKQFLPFMNDRNDLHILSIYILSFYIFSKMISFFLGSRTDKAQRKLAEININRSGWSNVTEFYQMNILVQTQITRSKHIEDYIKAMRKSEQKPENMLKYCALIHMILQDNDVVLTEPILEFLAAMLGQCHILTKKYIEVEQRKGNSLTIKKSFCNKSANQSPATSSRSEQTFVCKEVFLLTNIVKPYIAFLMKIVSTFVEYKYLFFRENIQSFQAWTIINFLKSITSFSCNFSVIGRYFMKYYGHLIILLTRVLCRDIYQYTYILYEYVRRQNYYLSTKTSLQSIQTEQLFKIISEISLINQDLLMIYLGKYFFIKISDLPQPKWINTHSKQFDKIFAIFKTQLPRQNFKLSQKTRSKSLIDGRTKSRSVK